jgi:uncharacterized protein with PQ loop repeat
MLNTHGGFAGLVDSILGVFNIILPVLVAVSLVLFFYGIVQYVYSQDNKKHGPIILWSLVALFIMLSLWGILRILENTFLGGTQSSSYSSGSPGGSAGNLPPLY